MASVINRKVTEKSDQPGTPITMRLGDNVIEQLKFKARKESFSRNKDLSYVDLIRAAIKKQYNIDCGEDNAVVTNEPRLLITDEPRGFWTKTDIEEFEASDDGQKFVKAIETGNFREIAALWLEQWDLWMKERSVGHKLLRFYPKSKKENFPEFVRDVACIAHVVSRRGTVPSQIIEGESIVVPSFEIAAAPEMHLSELKPHILFSTMCASIKAWQKELDTNVLRAMHGAVESRGMYTVKKPSQGGMDAIDAYETIQGPPPQLKETPELHASDILWAIKNVAQHQLIPSAIVLHEDRYCDLHSFGKDFIDAPPLKVALETREYGSVWGIPIFVSTQMDTDKVMVAAAPQSVGSLIEFSPPRVNFGDIMHKKRISIVESGEVGIVIINDYAIAVIEIKEE